MNVTMHLRLPESDIEFLKARAKELKTSVSALMTYKMREYLCGDLAVEQEEKEKEKQTTILVPVEVITEVKDFTNKKDMSFDELMRQAVSNIRKEAAAPDVEPPC